MLVANAEGGTVAIVDARSLRVLRELDVVPDGATASATAGDEPDRPARQGLIEAAGGLNYAQDQDLSPGGSTLYVSRGHRGDVAAFDIATGELRWKVPIPGLRADHMTLSQDGKRLYVSALTDDHVYAIDTERHVIAGSFETGQWPHDNHLSPDGARIYNGSIGAIVAPFEARPAFGPPPYLLTVAATDDLRVLRTYEFERGIRPYVITHDERRLFAQLSERSVVIEFDLESGAITRELELPVDAGTTSDDYDFEAPHHGLAMTPDEKTLCIAGRVSDYVALVATDSLQPVAIIEVDDAPGWAATDPLGKYCFVPNTRADTLSVISYAERREIARIKPGDGPKQVEAGRIPEAILCAKGDVPGCSGHVRFTLSCLTRGRVRAELSGDLDAVTRVVLRSGRRTLTADTVPPYERTLSARTLRRAGVSRLRAVIETTGPTLSRSRALPRCGRRAS